jgi:hypothetical protein
LALVALAGLLVGLRAALVLAAVVLSAVALAAEALTALVLAAVALAARGFDAPVAAFAVVVLGLAGARLAEAGLAGALASVPAGSSVLCEALRGCGIDALSLKRSDGIGNRAISAR